MIVGIIADTSLKISIIGTINMHTRYFMIKRVNYLFLRPLDLDSFIIKIRYIK